MDWDLLAHLGRHRRRDPMTFWLFIAGVSIMIIWVVLVCVLPL